jgi:hypothetical protein
MTYKKAHLIIDSFHKSLSKVNDQTQVQTIKSEDRHCQVKCLVNAKLVMLGTHCKLESSKTIMCNVLSQLTNNQAWYTISKYV